MTVVHLWRGNEKRHAHTERHWEDMAIGQPSSRQGWLQLDILVLTSALRTSTNTLLLFRSLILRYWQEDHSKMIWLRMKEKKKQTKTRTRTHYDSDTFGAYTCIVECLLNVFLNLMIDQLIPWDEMLCLGEPCMRTKIEEKWNEGKDSWTLLGEREKGGELPDHHFKQNLSSSLHETAWLSQKD